MDQETSLHAKADAETVETVRRALEAIPPHLAALLRAEYLEARSEGGRTDEELQAALRALYRGLPDGRQ